MSEVRLLDDRGVAGPRVALSRLAVYWGVHINTIYRDIRKGALRAFGCRAGSCAFVRLTRVGTDGRSSDQPSPTITNPHQSVG